jgi:hypothetical protein
LLLYSRKNPEIKEQQHHDSIQYRQRLETAWNDTRIRQDFFGLPGAHEFATYLHGEPIDSHPLTWAFRAGVNHSKSGEEPTPMGRIDATSVFRRLTDNSRCWGDS